MPRRSYNPSVYTQVDVVESQYQQFVRAVESNDFESVRRAHAVFVAGLTTKSHVLVRPLMEGIKSLLALIRRFASLFDRFLNAADIDHAEVLRLHVLYYPCFDKYTSVQTGYDYF